ncbi:hypothetical protein KSF_108930 [Reticulibacter mediterranei]|uniref:Uncharacterized protein n=1 Tax=Reticulibacter mediterranei TaxID=2778369 RepID=A0A8J3J201_9CHLR|nr:hypothetical protein [Reticulibacter mediterranei]GHP00846.1 hypothetical protein KSF_108930 [Reticulibacter mediterranei]
MKIFKLPLPEPWNIDTAVAHLYGAWSNQGREKIQQMERHNPLMVNALLTLWERDHHQQHGPKGVLPDHRSWKLLLHQNGTGIIVLEY